MSGPVYDESSVRSLSSLEHIRARPGMYIGRLGDGRHADDGIYVLLKEVVDNAIDEFVMGHGREIRIRTADDGTVEVRDFGRGIPPGKLVDCVSRINTGAKYGGGAFRYSVGLNGVGTKAVNALSATFFAATHRGGRRTEAGFERGRLVHEASLDADGEPDGTLVRFRPDPEIFGDEARFDREQLVRRVRMYAFLNAGLTVELDGTPHVSDDGLLDLVRERAGRDVVYLPMHRRDATLEVAFTHTTAYGEQYLSFVNGQHTVDGGTHLSAFREGFLKAVAEVAGTRLDGDDVRDGLLAAVAIRLEEPIFESQTKNKLGNTEIRAGLVTRVRETVADLLHRDPEGSRRLLHRVEQAAKLRAELQSVRKAARERARAASIRVPQLKDCKRHRGDTRDDDAPPAMLFIAEGQSAAGSLTSTRDPETQAVFTLKGKPLNVCELERDALYKNDELYNLMRALGVEESTDGLRYDRIVLATDADVDGLHIRNLLLTYFLRFFEPLVLEGRVFILDTPLFRVRTKRRTIYCYSDAERDAAKRTLGRGVEITRFKGLGEISPAEFAPFIGESMRLTRVELDELSSVPPLLRFYMGRNTPERRGYIMERLVVRPEA